MKIFKTCLSLLLIINIHLLYIYLFKSYYNETCYVNNESFKLNLYDYKNIKNISITIYSENTNIFGELHKSFFDDKKFIIKFDTNLFIIIIESFIKIDKDNIEFKLNFNDDDNSYENYLWKKEIFYKDKIIEDKLKLVNCNNTSYINLFFNSLLISRFILLITQLLIIYKLYFCNNKFIIYFLIVVFINILIMKDLLNKINDNYKDYFYFINIYNSMFYTYSGFIILLSLFKLYNKN